MKTEIIMKRNLLGFEIKQKSKCEYLSATDLIKAGNAYRITHHLSLFNLSSFLKSDNTKEFINELEHQEGKKIIVTSRGKHSNTWVHPYLFIKIALAMNPKLEVKVIKWLYDYLLKYRNESGDSYKKMTGALYKTSKNVYTFPKEITLIAKKIKESINIEDWNQATEKQLKLRDKIHNNIYILADIINDKDTLLDLAIKKANEDN